MCHPLAVLRAQSAEMLRKNMLAGLGRHPLSQLPDAGMRGVPPGEQANWASKNDGKPALLRSMVVSQEMLELVTKARDGTLRILEGKSRRNSLIVHSQR
jgi:hypothetical protein